MFPQGAGYYVVYQAILAYRPLWSSSVSGLDVIGVLVGEPWFPTSGGVQPHFLHIEASSQDCSKSGSSRQSICRLAWSRGLKRFFATRGRPNSRIRKKAAPPIEFMPLSARCDTCLGGAERLRVRCPAGTWKGQGCGLILNTHSLRSRSNRRWMI